VPLERRRVQQLNVLTDALSIVLAALQKDAATDRVELACLKLSAPPCNSAARLKGCRSLAADRWN
jgi:hypothetical protein